MDEFAKMKRILIIAGHYGSGKTEFAVNLAVYAKKKDAFGYSKVALVDLDVVNPYFRSRDRVDMLKGFGVDVYGSFYGGNVTAEIPELSALVRAPLEDQNTFTIVDAGGNESGARVMRQFTKYFTPSESSLLIVINNARPETQTVSGALSHMKAIEAALGISAEGLISNTHLLRETSYDDVLHGYLFSLEVAKISAIPIICCCYPENFVKRSDLESVVKERLFPLKLYMRDSWLDK